MSEPVICFGQQPSGFFPKRFLYSKFITARRLRSEIGGRVVFFYHDADHDPRETMTILADRHSGKEAHLNFAFENKIQKQYSPLNLKRIAAGWQDKLVRQLPQYVERDRVELFASIRADNPADFCLEMYRGMGLLEGVEIVRSSDPAVREAAIDVGDYFVDAPYEGEIVRARLKGQELVLHKGGDAFIPLPPIEYGKAQISPTRDTRLRWMQSVIGCTHYIAGAGEIGYLNTAETPEIEFVPRDAIERSGDAYV